MSKKLRLSIPEPCHEDWEKMTPVEKGRFCDSCQKQVIDFSSMSDREIGLFFKKQSNGSLCGRFVDEQLNRDIEIPKKRIPWIKYFFQFALPAFMVSAKANAQGKVEANVKTETVDKPVKDKQNTSSENTIANTRLAQTIARQIVNPVTRPCRVGGMAVVRGAVSAQEIKKQNIPAKQKVPTKVIRDTMMTIPVSKQILSNQINQLSVRPVISPGNSIANGLQNKLTGTVGGLYIGVNVTAAKPDTLFTRLLKKYLPASFRIFPNPVESGGMLHIEWKENETGDYLLQLINQSGQTILNKVIWIDKDARLLELPVPPVTAGIYFLYLNSKQSGKSFTEKIIIQ